MYVSDNDYIIIANRGGFANKNEINSSSNKRLIHPCDDIIKFGHRLMEFTSKYNYPNHIGLNNKYSPICA
jgi:hypothetical protein